VKDYNDDKTEQLERDMPTLIDLSTKMLTNTQSRTIIAAVEYADTLSDKMGKLRRFTVLFPERKEANILKET
jgi:hypothetical protein